MLIECLPRARHCGVSELWCINKVLPLSPGLICIYTHIHSNSVYVLCVCVHGCIFCKNAGSEISLPGCTSLTGFGTSSRLFHKYCKALLLQNFPLSQLPHLKQSKTVLIGVPLRIVNELHPSSAQTCSWYKASINKCRLYLLNTQMLHIQYIYTYYV